METKPTQENLREHYGLPSSAQLKKYKIWDSYFTPAHSNPGKDGLSAWNADMHRSQRAISIGCIEKLCYFPHVGIGTTADQELERKLAAEPGLILSPLQQFPDLLIAMLQINGNNVSGSLEAIERWIADGPMVGAYFPGGGPGALVCHDKKFDPIIERLADLDAVMMHHTWFKTGGKTSQGESTPAELCSVAKRYPEQVFIAAHAGGEWEKGVRSVRESPNVWIETSGFDATAGFMEMAVRELGPKRIVFGSHLPSRSLGTELSKVVHAEISEQAKHRILGENFRSLVNRHQRKKLSDQD